MSDMHNPVRDFGKLLEQKKPRTPRWQTTTARIALWAIWAVFAQVTWRAVDGLAMYLLVMGLAFAGVLFTLFVFDRDMR